jgi:V/A-type H+/Na+-transporting ATPase subunit D
VSLQRTRMALLAARSRLGLARQGQVLLEQKRDALLREFYREVRVVFAAREELDAAARSARVALDEARVRLGGETVAAAAAGSRGDVTIEMESTTVMGVPVATIAPRSLVRPADARGRDPSISGPALELAAERFEEELAVAIRLATVEARVRRLAAEIHRTSSRVNALRTRVVPGLENEVRTIAFSLEQREREDRFRLKRVKAARTRRVETTRRPAAGPGPASSPPGPERAVATPGPG